MHQQYIHAGIWHPHPHPPPKKSWLDIWHLQTLELVESDRHQSQCNYCSSCLVFFFSQCRDKNGVLRPVENFAPCGIFAGNVEYTRAENYGYFLSVEHLFFIFVNRHHSLNQEVVGLSVNRDHNILTMQRRKMCRATVIRLCMISISIAVSLLTTSCYTVSHSGTSVTLICDVAPDFHFRLAGTRWIQASANTWQFSCSFVHVWVYIVHLRAAVDVAI